MSPWSDDKRLRAEAFVGRVLRDTWRLDRVLGIGGSGAVYAATHRAGKQVALKLLHPELSQDRRVRTRFLREAHAANRVAHPGAVSVLDNDVSEDGTAFLVMDLLEGETLKARVERTGARLEWTAVLSIADQVLDVLIAAHGKGIIHRDIKPENVFLTTEGQIKLLDFGIARFHELSPGNQTTQTGSPMGTPAFMPPEQSAGRWERVDARSDLWSLGATMFTLLTGRLVHGDLTPAEALVASITKPAPPIGSLMPGLPAPVAAIIDRALALERDQRWPDAQAMQQAVRDAHQTIAGSSLSTASPFTLSSAASIELLASSVPSGTQRSLSASPARTKLWIASGIVATASLVVAAALMGRRAAEAPARDDTASATAPAQASPTAPAGPVESATTVPSPLPASASAAKPRSPDASPRPVNLGRPSTRRPSAAPAPGKSTEDPFARRR